MTTRDLPDYTRQVTVRHEGAFAGLEEMAIRLGSIAPWDLYGHAILLEDFESEETEWTLTTSGTGSAASRQTRHKFSGDWALKLVAGDEENAYAYAARQIHHPGTLKCAIFGRLAWDENLQLWLFGATSEIAGVARYAWVRYNLPSTTLEVMTGPNTYTAISSSLTISTSGFVFHPILITFDMSDMSYDKLYVDGTEYDLSAYDLGSAVTSPGPYLEAKVRCETIGSTGCTIYVDDVIIAKNVP